MYSKDAGGGIVSGAAVGFDVLANACRNVGIASVSAGRAGDKARNLAAAASETSEPAETVGADSPDG